jgi:uncharacterized SAM-dependent methyltransferase
MRRCNSALRKFTTEDLWRDFIKVEGAGGAVLLGAGAPHKDFIILKSWMEHSPAATSIHYALVDYSFYMLESSWRAVDRMLIRAGLSGRVQLTPIKHDFLDLRSAEKLRFGDQPVGWFILGGTIGNVNERHFFRSVASVASDGDFLIVGAETISPGAGEPLRQALTTEFLSFGTSFGRRCKLSGTT